MLNRYFAVPKDNRQLARSHTENRPVALRTFLHRARLTRALAMKIAQRRCRTHRSSYSKDRANVLAAASADVRWPLARPSKFPRRMFDILANISNRSGLSPQAKWIAF